MKAKRFVVPLILAFGLAAISGLALDWDLGAASALRRFFTNATVSQPGSAAWRFQPDDTGKLLRSHPEDFVYLELIEENSDTFAEQLFKADPPSLPAPFVFQDGLLKIDATLAQVSNPDLGIFVEDGRATDRQILLAHWNFYTGVGRRYEQAEYYILNEPSRSVALPESDQRADIRYTPSDSLMDTLDIRLLPGAAFSIPAATAEGSVRFSLDGQTIELKPGAQYELGIQSRQAHLTELNPYGSEIDYGVITFTTRLTLVNYGSPESVEIISSDSIGGGQQP